MTPPRILMTGATGALGRSVAAELVERGCELVVLVRGRDDRDARRRVCQALGRASAGIEVVRGDLRAEDVVSNRAGRALARSADVVVHAAATTELGLPLEAARRVNVSGTRAVLRLAHRIPALQKVVHVSTAFVAGKRCGHVLEPQLQHAGFVSAYEQSKYEAERLVRAHSQVLPIAIVRPSVVVERPDTPRTSPFWRAMGLVATGRLPFLPGRPTNTLDLISLEDAASAIARLVLARGALGTYHVASGDRAPRVTDVVREAAGRSIRFLDRGRFDQEARRLSALRDAAGSYEDVAAFVQMLGFPKTFDTARAEAVLGRHPCSGAPLSALGTSFPVARVATC